MTTRLTVTGHRAANQVPGHTPAASTANRKSYRGEAVASAEVETTADRLTDTA